MFIKLTNDEGVEFYLNTDNVTVIKPCDYGSKFYLTDGGFGTCQESPSQIIEKINQV